MSLKLSFRPTSICDRENIISIRRNGNKVLLLTIRPSFYPRRQMHWKCQSTSGENEFDLRKLWLSQNTVVLYFGFSPSLSIFSIGLFCSN